jgi:hypothetical protein
MRASTTLSMLLCSAPIWAADIPSSSDQIAAAVLAAPKEWREGAAVLGYSDKGEVVSLRKGTNDFVCLASDPKAKNFSVACYHKDLEPYMERGRALTAEGMKGKERQEVRWKEVEAGKLAMPKGPRTLYVLGGSGYDSAKGEVTNGELRWVVYIPYATPESTGLSTSAGPGPWLMYPGTPGAHIMFSSQKK